MIRSRGMHRCSTSALLGYRMENKEMIEDYYRHSDKSDIFCASCLPDIEEEYGKLCQVDCVTQSRRDEEILPGEYFAEPGCCGKVNGHINAMELSLSV